MSLAASAKPPTLDELRDAVVDAQALRQGTKDKLRDDPADGNAINADHLAQYAVVNASQDYYLAALRVANADYERAIAEDDAKRAAQGKGPRTPPGYLGLTSEVDTTRLAKKKAEEELRNARETGFGVPERTAGYAFGAGAYKVALLTGYAALATGALSARIAEDVARFLAASVPSSR